MTTAPDAQHSPQHDDPSIESQVVALASFAHFIRMGWNPADLSLEDKHAIATAIQKFPGVPG